MLPAESLLPSPKEMVLRDNVFTGQDLDDASSASFRGDFLIDLDAKLKLKILWTVF